MYVRPQLQRFGLVSALTQSGCVDTTDGAHVAGIGNATGSEPTTDGTTEKETCWNNS